MEPSPKHPQLREYFQQRILAGLKLFHKPLAGQSFFEKLLNFLPFFKKAPGYKLLYIYNMGFLLKTGMGIIAFDLVSTRKVWGLNWSLPDSFLEALTEHIDMAFYSHFHPDHSDPEIMELLLSRKKPVIIPGWDWTNFPGACTRHFPGKRNEIQLAKEKIIIDTWKGLHVYQKTVELPLAVYEITFPCGYTLLHAGDHDYTRSLAERHADKIDLLIMKYGGISPKIKDEEAASIAIERFNPGRVVLCHLQELGHPPKGGRLPFTDALRFKNSFSTPVMQVPFWGEFICLD
ncbi:MBL fold metallo-hydrolase [Candidatus Riflebacteria bacterium]